MKMQNSVDGDSLDNATYGPLNPEKWTYYRERVQQFSENRSSEIVPVTVHLVPTLRCNHLCYFCTYGGAKGSKNPMSNGRRAVDNSSLLRTKQKDMPYELLVSAINQLSELGTRGIIFSGGGEPTLYSNLTNGAKVCKEKGLNFSLNTNGFRLSDDLLDNLLPLEPDYIRVSLNAGSAEVQKLTTGIDNFESVVANVERLLRKKHYFRAKTDISIGFVVNVINVYDIVPITHRMIELEKKLKQEGNENGVYSIQFRPVSNYESSKQYNAKQMDNIYTYLDKRSGESDVDEFRRFMFNDEQCSSRIFDLALQVINQEVTPLIKNNDSKINIVYPYKKFIDIPRLKAKPYDICRALPWVLFIWPDGTLYPCVEWAGTPGFEIGNISEMPIKDILVENRKNKIDWINETVFHSRCAPACAHHEINLSMQKFFSECIDTNSQTLNSENMDTPKHISFL